MARITEDHLEQQFLEWFKELGYAYAFAPDLAPDGTSPERSDFRQVILTGSLRSALQRLNPDVPAGTIESAVLQLANPQRAWSAGIEPQLPPLDDPRFAHHLSGWEPAGGDPPQGDRVRRSRRQRLVGSEPAGDPGIQVQPPPGSGGLRQRSAPGGDRTQEPRRSQGRHLGSVQPTPDLQARHPRSVHIQCAAGDQRWHPGPVG